MKDTNGLGLAGDIRGGASAGLVTLLECIPMGLIAFAPLGADFLPIGILAALYGSVFATLLISLTGGTPGMLSGPAPALCPLFAAVLVQFGTESSDPQMVLTLTLMSTALAGLIQIGMGLTRADFLVKFISYPVVAGLVTGIGILIMRTQIGQFMGIEHARSFHDIWTHLDEVKPWNLGLGIVVAYLYWNKNRWFTGVTGFIVVLLTGTGLYYGLLAAGVSVESLGPALGPISFEWPSLAYAEAMVQLSSADIFLRIVPTALTVAIFTSILALLASISYRNLSNVTPDTRRELMGQGFGNILSAFLGGLPSSGTFSRTNLCHQEGGRSRLVGVASAACTLLLALLLAGVVQYLPLILIAGIMCVIGVKMVDRWTLKLIADLARGRVPLGRDSLLSVGTAVFVAITTVSGNLLLAVALGVGISILVFLLDTRGTAIRRIYASQSIPSKKQHDESSTKLLQKHSDAIRVIEVSGPLYFGSAEYLVNQIEELAALDTDFIILDFKQVSSIDLTGARLMQMACASLREQGKELALCGFNQSSPLHSTLEHTRFFTLCPDVHVFPDTDRALEHFESQLMLKLQSGRPEHARPIEQSALFANMEKEDVERVLNLLTEAEYERGATIVTAGEQGGGMFFISKGVADVFITVGEGTERRERRVQSFGAGTFFGEVSLLQRGVRIATVVAQEPVTCYLLAQEDFDRLLEENPGTSVHLLKNLSQILAKRLAFLNQIIAEMDV